MSRPIALRVVEGHARVYRHTWRGTTVSTVVTPVLFLGAMGLGLGTLVDAGPAAALGGVDYLTWLAPGLLAGSAMQQGAGDGSFPVVAGIHWDKTYHAALATPVRPRDLMLGNLAWSTVRAAVAAAVFVAVAVAFGAMEPGRGAVAALPALLTAAGSCAVLSGIMAAAASDRGLSTVHRFAVTPLFLFSGTFFPVSQLPDAVEAVAWAVPLWHGVELTRAAALGRPPAGPWLLHLAVLVGVLVLGTAASAWSFRRRLHR